MIAVSCEMSGDESLKGDSSARKLDLAFRTCTSNHTYCFFFLSHAVLFYRERERDVAKVNSWANLLWQSGSAAWLRARRDRSLKCPHARTHARSRHRRCQRRDCPAMHPFAFTSSPMSEAHLPDIRRLSSAAI